METKTLSTCVSQNSISSPHLIKLKIDKQKENSKQIAPIRKFKVQKVENKVKEKQELNIDNLNPKNNINSITQIFDNGDGNEVQKRMNEIKKIECNNSINYNNCLFSPNSVNNPFLTPITPNNIFQQYNQNLYNYYWTSLINNKFQN